MKKIKNVLLVGLTAFSLMGLAGCKKDDPKTEYTNQNEEQKNDDGIEVISSEPSTGFDEKTKNKVRELYKILPDEEIEEAEFLSEVENFAKGNLSNEYVQKLVDFIIKTKNMFGDEELSLEGSNKFLDAFKNDQEFKNYFYDLISLIKSIDASKISNLTDKIEEMLSKALTISEDPDAIYDFFMSRYYNIDDYFNSFNSAKVERLKELSEKYTEEAALKSAYEAVVDFKNHFFISEDAIDFYKEYKKQFGGNKLINTLFDLIKKNGNSIQDASVSTLKGIVDSLPLSLIKKFVGIIESGKDIEIYDSNGDMGFLYDTKSFVLEFLNENKATVINLLKTLTNEKLCSTILTIASSLNLEEIYKVKSDAAKDRVSKFANKIKALNGAQLKSVFNFVIAVLEKLDFEETYNAVLSSMVTGDFGDAIKLLAPVLNDVVSSLSGSDKDNINKVLGIFGIDLFKVINDIVALNNDSLSTKEGKQEAGKKMNEIFESVTTAFGKSVPKGDTKDELKDYYEKNPTYDFSKDSNLYSFNKGDNIEVKDIFDDVSVTINDGDTKIIEIDKLEEELGATYTFVPCKTENPGLYVAKLIINVADQEYTLKALVLIKGEDELKVIEDDYMTSLRTKGSAFIKKGEDYYFNGNKVNTSEPGWNIALTVDNGYTYYSNYYVYEENELAIKATDIVGKPFLWLNESTVYGSWSANIEVSIKDVYKAENEINISYYEVDEPLDEKSAGEKTTKYTTEDGLVLELPYEVVDPTTLPIEKYRIDFNDIYKEGFVNGSTLKVKAKQVVTKKSQSAGGLGTAKADYILKEDAELELVNVNIDETYGKISFTYNNKIYKYSLAQ